jgi:hypothetical protein
LNPGTSFPVTPCEKGHLEIQNWFDNIPFEGNLDLEWDKPQLKQFCYWDANRRVGLDLEWAKDV